MLQTITLKNGIKVATFSVPQMKSVYISIAVKAGSIFDTKKTSGTAHFMEHILFEGTPSFPNIEALSDYIESLAGTYNASTESQIIKFYINGPINHVEDLVKITSEVFFEPLFPRFKTLQLQHLLNLQSGAKYFLFPDFPMSFLLFPLLCRFHGPVSYRLKLLHFHSVSQ